MTKVTFLLPVVDEDGRNLMGDIVELLDAIYDVFGGYTQHGEVSGTYRMADGSKATDHLACISVAFEDQGHEGKGFWCKHGNKTLDTLLAIIQTFKARTLQEAVYVEVQRDADIRFV